MFLLRGFAGSFVIFLRVAILLKVFQWLSKMRSKTLSKNLSEIFPKVLFTSSGSGIKMKYILKHHIEQVKKYVINIMKEPTLLH